MSVGISRTASDFIRKYDVNGKLTSERMKDILDSQGYTVVEFGISDNPPEVDELIGLLSLGDMIRYERGFTYADSNSRIVFVNNDLNEYETLLVLLHEQGHILLGHMGTQNVIGRDVVQEHEANEFLHYVLHPALPAKMYIHRKLTAAAAVLLIIAAAGSVVAVKHSENGKYYGDYYVTATGHKYHKADCIFIKNKEGVRRMTREEYESGQYKPCEVCMPADE